MDEWRRRKCRLCGGTNFQILGRRSAEVPTRKGKLTIEIEDAVCERCSFAQNALSPPQGFLDRLYANQFLNFQHTVDSGHYDASQRLINLQEHVSEGLVIEFGSGSSEFCDFLNNTGYLAVGVDPGKSAKYEHLCDAPSNASAIVAYDVIEHLDDPRAALREIRTHLSGDGILIVEVPDFERHADTALGPLHISYFRAPHLQAMIKAEEFTIINFANASREASLCIIARRSEKTANVCLEDQTLFRSGQTIYRQWQKDKAEQRRKHCDKIDATSGFLSAHPDAHVYVWPANDIATSIAPLLPASNFDPIPTDSSGDKIGVLWPGFQRPVVAPEIIENDDRPKAIILCSPAWNSDIAKRIADWSLVDSMVVPIC